MKGGIGNLMKQAQKMQEDMQKAQEELLKDDKDMLEDLIAAAMNDASNKVEELTKDQMSGLTSGMNLPPGMKLPF